MEHTNNILPNKTCSYLSNARSGTFHFNHLQIFTGNELANIFGVRISELGKLNRSGIFRRIGSDKYLADYHKIALLFGEHDKVLSPMGISESHSSTENNITLDIELRYIKEFYQKECSIQVNSVNIINLPNLQNATLSAGVFVEEGLQLNQRIAILSFVHPSILFSRFSDAGLKFDDALQTEQLIYLYYKPDVTRNINLSLSYSDLFDEIMRLSGADIQRLILFNVDALVNTNSEHLVHSSLHQLIYSASHYQVTLLGLFVSSGRVSELLDEGCRAILPGYFVMN